MASTESTTGVGIGNAASPLEALFFLAALAVVVSLATALATMESRSLRWSFWLCLITFALTGREEK